jgi:energy-coupling factor transporter ATP-binding protein EcfA2
MDLEAITEQLIAGALTEGLNRVSFGRLAQSLPAFDVDALIAFLGPDRPDFQLALLGFGDGHSGWPKSIARDVEDVVAWRNDRDVKVPVLVIAAPTHPLEKIHSLEMFEIFSDRDLKRYVYDRGLAHARQENNYVAQAVWTHLKNADRAKGGSQRLIGANVIRYYAALVDRSVGEALPELGLLADPELNKPQAVPDRLQLNQQTVEWLSSIDSEGLRNLARAEGVDDSSLSHVYAKLRAYLNGPSTENLRRLSLEEVRRLRFARKAPVTRRQTDEKITPAEHIVNQLLDSTTLANDERDSLLKQIAEEASAVAQLYQVTAPNDSADEWPNMEDGEDAEPVTLRDRSGDEVAQIKPSDDDEQRHPLEDALHNWLRPTTWGGLIEAEVESTASLPQLFRSKIPLQATLFRPLDDNSRSLLSLLNSLSGAAPSVAADLPKLLLHLAAARQGLLNYHDVFLYYPSLAVRAEQLGPTLKDYLQSYDALSRKLDEACRQLQERFPDAVQRVIAQFLALDVFFVRMHGPDHTTRLVAFLSSLHPLHLWKWLQLDEYWTHSSNELNGTERAVLREAISHLPPVLNTLLVHIAMFSETKYNETVEVPRDPLVLAGELANPRNDTNVGIPYYDTAAHFASGPTDLKEFAARLPDFLRLYPPAQLGLVLVLIDPPQIAPILQALDKLHGGSNAGLVLEGARVYVYRTRPREHDEWTSRDEKVLELFRTDRRWMLYLDIPIRLLTTIADDLRGRQIQPHITLLCDPSTNVARSTFRTIQEEATAFGLPVQVSYDEISDRVQTTPIATGGLLDTYSSLRHTVMADQQRTVYGLGTRPVTSEELTGLLDGEPGASWLAVVDRPQGNLTLPDTLGQRLLWTQGATRSLVICTRQADWDRIWARELQQQLTDLGLTVEQNQILRYFQELTLLFPNGLLDLVDKLPGRKLGALDSDALANMLAALVALRWYRYIHHDAVLIPIGGDDFADWFGDRQSDRSFYFACWSEAGMVHADVIAICGTSPVPDPSAVFAVMASFAANFLALFGTTHSESILTPNRRALIRERLTGYVFGPRTGDSTSVISPTKETKARWATTINQLFSPNSACVVRQVQLVVALDRTDIAVTEEILPQTEAAQQPWLRIKLSASLLSSDVSRVGEAHATVVPPSSGSQGSNETLAPNLPDNQPPTTSPETMRQAISVQSQRLRRVLDAYGLAVADVDVAKTQVGPRFVRYWVRLQPPAGRLSEVQRHAEDIAREMGSRTVPYIDNIPGEQYVGIDLARDDPSTIPLAPALERLARDQGDQLLVAIGQDPAGQDVQLDLAHLPHMLVAGQTGSGKTVFLSSLIMSLVQRHPPNRLQLILVDPKQMDFGIFGQLPHLFQGKILYEPEEAVQALQELLEHERPRRTELIHKAACPNNLEYNRRNPDQPIPWLVVVIDEFADIILSVERRQRETFERQVNRLAAAGRAAGIHLIVATQRPTTDIITGTIKANFTARVSFRLPSQIDSRTILDRPGAENLLGAGDMLVSINGDVQRLQGYYASYDELSVLSHNGMR